MLLAAVSKEPAALPGAATGTTETEGTHSPAAGRLVGERSPAYVGHTLGILPEIPLSTSLAVGCLYGSA